MTRTQADREFDWETGRELERKDAEIARLQADLASALEDRARFPDKPDGVGRMIEAHIGNLKLGKESADEHAIRALNTAAQLRTALTELHDALITEGEHSDGSLLDEGCNVCEALKRASRLLPSHEPGQVVAAGQ